jgi:hypothetical protein
MAFVLSSDTVFKIRRKSDQKYYSSHRYGGSFVSSGGDICSSAEDAGTSKANLERNIDDLSYGDLEVVECAIVPKDILLILDE